MSYTVRLLGDTAEFVFTFSAAVNITSSRCFFDKLLLGNDAMDNFFRAYQPLYPGICQTTDVSSVVMAILDPRDFRPTLEFFSSIQTLNILSVPRMELYFLPLIPLLPIRSPLRASELVHNPQPRMLSFDVDYNTSQVVLHFNDYMDVSSLQPTQLTLIDPVSGNRLTLGVNTVASVGLDDQLVRTICVTVDSESVASLWSMSICTNMADTCACYFTPDLVTSHSRVPVQGVPDSLPLPVSTATNS